MSFDGDLGWANGGKGVDHAETVTAAWGDGEDFQRGVGHETGVGVTELSLAVDEQRFGILTGVDGETTWVPFGGIFVEPIAYQHDVRGQIEVVQVRVGVTGRGLADDDASVETIQLLETGVSVPEVSTCVTGPLVSGKRRSVIDSIKIHSIWVSGSQGPLTGPFLRHSSNKSVLLISIGLELIFLHTTKIRLSAQMISHFKNFH